MNTFADALNKAGIQATDFKDVAVDEKKIQCDLEIEFLDKWLKLEERGASDKEKYLFATEHGFLSAKHLMLWISLSSDVSDLEEELYDSREFLSAAEIQEKERELKGKRQTAEAIRNNPYYYKIMMRKAGARDISPYGMDILNDRPFAPTKKERAFQVYRKMFS